MEKKLFGIKLKTILVFLIILLSITSVSVAYNRSVMKHWQPPEALLGRWAGQSEISSQFRKGQSPGEDPADWVRIEITVTADGRVIGMVGNAELVDCTVRLNRTSFERFIGIKTDYIITGSLNNSIVPADTAVKRSISIPYNLSDEGLKGSIFEVESWQYPDPLFPRLLLTLEETI